MKERIAQIIQREELTAAQFAEKIGISASSLSHILSGRNNPSLEVVMKIHKACNDVSLDWLLYGEGEISISSIQMQTDQNQAYSAPESAFSMTNDEGGTEYRKEIGSTAPILPTKEVVREEIKYVERPARKITEIRIFFDNGTYETFKPAN